MSNNQGGPVDTDVAKVKVSAPVGPRQSSGKVQHARMHIAPKVENLNKKPVVHD